MRYAIVIKNTEANYPAQVPDLPGCVTTVAIVVDVEHGICEAIDLHLGGIPADGKPILGISSVVA